MNQPLEEKNSKTPWYFRKKSPIFCECWRPFYKMFWPLKIPLVIIACLLICAGLVIFIAGIIICAIVRCEASIVSLFPIGIQFIIVGLILLHCGWASYLLDEENMGKLSSKYQNVAGSGLDYETGDDREAAGGREPDWEVNPPDITRPGHWQFVDKEAWQIVSSRDHLY